MLLNKTIRLFLDSIGRRDEYEFYLNKFQSADTTCFALLVPDRESLEQGAEALAFDLHFLLKLGLQAAIVLCGAGADAKWKILEGDSLFERTSFPVSSINPGRIPVFVNEEMSPVDSLLQKVYPASDSGGAALGKRVHFIRASGGLPSDYYYTRKSNRRVGTVKDRELIATASALLEACPGTHVSVSSPMNLLEEIFTVKGAGTVFRRGSAIQSSGMSSVDESKLMDLLEESFGKTPKPVALAAVSRVYYEENYRGAVLLEEQAEGLYLSKFAVGREARGEGLAQELWDDVCQNHSAFFWRSRKGNPINSWYDRQADGYHTTNGWLVFWRGMPVESLPGLIKFCAGRVSDFISD